jgi:AcrR family transcriptional regulator
MSPRRASVVRDQSDVTPALALRRHLISVTKRLLELHGLAGLTTRQIAREAAVSDGVLYNHFQGKDGLVLAALTDSFGELMGEFREAVPVPGEGEVRDNLVRLAEASTSYLGRVFPMAVGLAGQPELLSQAMAALHSGTTGPQDVIALVADYLRAEQALGRLDRDADADAGALLLFGGCHVAVMLQRTGHPGRETTTADLVDALLAGAGAPPAG